MAEALREQEEGEVSFAVEGVPSEYVNSAWHFIRRWVEAAYEHVPCPPSTEEVLEALLDSRAQMWLISKNPEGPVVGCILTEILVRPAGVVLSFKAVGGRGLPMWLPEATQTIESWARAEGCVGARMEGRPGWERVFKAYGFERCAVVLFKSLED